MFTPCSFDDPELFIVIPANTVFNIYSFSLSVTAISLDSNCGNETRVNTTSYITLIPAVPPISKNTLLGVVVSSGYIKSNE